MQKFLGVKVGGGSWLANMELKSSTWNRNSKSCFSNTTLQFSAHVDADYDIKESITDIQQTVQWTLYEHFYYKQGLLAIGDCFLLVNYYSNANAMMTVKVSGYTHQRPNWSQHIILQSPRVLEQYNSTYISTYIVVQCRLYTGPIFHFKLMKL